jgi:hypothetical protein
MPIVPIYSERVEIRLSAGIPPDDTFVVNRVRFGAATFGHSVFALEVFGVGVDAP